MTKMKKFDFHSCENCIFHKHEYWYDEDTVIIDYCESQHGMIEWDTKDKNECLRFMPKIQVRKEEDTPKIYIKELKPEDNAREVEFALVEVFDDRFEFERQVGEKLNDGWKPVGGVCYESGCYLMGLWRTVK